MFLKFLLVFIVLLLVVRLVESFAGSKRSQSKNSTGFNSGRKEGEISVDNRNAQKDKKISKSTGEYVDYEEL